MLPRTCAVHPIACEERGEDREGIPLLLHAAAMTPPVVQQEDQQSPFLKQMLNKLICQLLVGIRLQASGSFNISNIADISLVINSLANLLNNLQGAHSFGATPIINLQTSSVC